MTLFTAVVTAHDQDPRPIIDQLTKQTVPPCEMLVYASGDVPELLTDGFEIIRVENKEDWGHDKRAQGLALAKGEWIGFFNADDQYDPQYLEIMLRHAQGGFGTDVVYCDWCGKDSPEETVFRGRNSTVGNFIVRTAIAREAGYTDRHYMADATFIDRILALEPRVSKAQSPVYLYQHA